MFTKRSTALFLVEAILFAALLVGCTNTASTKTPQVDIPSPTSASTSLSTLFSTPIPNYPGDIYLSPLPFLQYPDQNPLQMENTLSPTDSPAPTSFPERIEIHFPDLGLLWRECELPRPNNENQEECLGVTMTKRDENDPFPFGETFTPPNGLRRGFRLTIGSDVFEALHQPSLDGGFSDANGILTYNLFKNGELQISMTTTMGGYDPNAGLLNINGKYAWEFANPKQPTIIYDGVDIRQKYGLEAAYRPYVIGDKMIFVARNDGKMYVIADGQQIGPEFDEILNGYCCETKPIIRSPGQYWFWATNEGQSFVVVIGEP